MTPLSLGHPSGRPRSEESPSSSPMVAVAVLGARRHYAVARILQDEGRLAGFFTDSYAGQWPRLTAVVGGVPGVSRVPVLRRWLGRRHPRLSRHLVYSSESLGLRYWWHRGLGGARIEQAHARAAALLAKRVAARSANDAAIVWGLNGASVELFRWARGRRLKCVLEQVYAPQAIADELLARERERWTGWHSEGMSQSRLLRAREEEEWSLADRIVSPSEFVTEGLYRWGVPTEKCRLVPFGVDLDAFPVTTIPEDSPPRRRLRVLFVGEVGIRKGAPYLLQALASLGSQRVEARFAGTLALDPARLAEFSTVARFLGPVPRMDMRQHWDWADVLVLPSLCEGSALVTYEALASGLPVVATPNTGSPVRDGRDGCVVPTGDSALLARALGRYFAEPDLLAAHRRDAATNRARVGFDRYRGDLVAALEGL